MFRYLSKSILLLFVLVFICCVLYPLVLWAIGQTVLSLPGQRQPADRS